jgi:hypothetical protein
MRATALQIRRLRIADSLEGLEIGGWAFHSVIDGGD